MKNVLYLYLVVAALISCSDNDNSYEEGDIVLDKTELIVEKGWTEQLTVTVNPSNAAYIWSCSDYIAKVDSTGLVTGLELGETELIATMLDVGKMAVCKVTVVPLTVKSVVLNPLTLQLECGTSKSLKAEVGPYGVENTNVSWSSMDENVATVTESGVVMAKGVGKTKIIVTTEENNCKDSCDVEVIAAIPDFKFIDERGRLVDKVACLLMNPGDTYQIRISIEDEALLDSVVYKSEDESVATVNSTGKVVGLKAGGETRIAVSLGTKTKYCDVILW